MDQETVKKLESKMKVTISSWDKQAKQDENDLAMLEQEGQIMFAVDRAVCHSELFVELLCRFGQAEGFESLLGILEN